MPRMKLFHYVDQAEVKPVELDAETIDSWMTAADEREGTRIFEQMDALLDELRFRYPIRVWRLRQDVPWLCKQARKRQIKWGQ
jgi:hypothetical protein